MGFSYDEGQVRREVAAGLGARSQDSYDEAAYSLEDGSDLSLLQVERDTPADELLAIELEALAYECELASSYDPEARRLLELVATFMEGLQRLRSRDIAFEGSTDVELGALAQSMHEANPDAEDAELMNLVFELLDHIGSLPRRTERETPVALPLR